MFSQLINFILHIISFGFHSHLKLNFKQGNIFGKFRTFSTSQYFFFYFFNFYLFIRLSVIKLMIIFHKFLPLKFLFILNICHLRNNNLRTVGLTIFLIAPRFITIFNIEFFVNKAIRCRF